MNPGGRVQDTPPVFHESTRFPALDFRRLRPTAVSKRSKKKQPAQHGAPVKGSGGNVVAQARSGKGSSKSSLLTWTWENVKSLAGAVLIYLVIKTFLMEAFRIPSGSMIPTLMVGDWLFVNKVAYGPHLPFTNSHLPGYHTPTHGDVVVFVSP